MSTAGLPSAGSLLRGAWKLYLPMAVIAGSVVAAPTLLAHSAGGRAVGVVLGVAMVAVGFVAVVRRGRSAAEGGVRQRTSIVSGVALTHASEGAPGAAAGMMRRMRRLQMLARLWLPLSATGLLAGGLVGAAVGSFLLTVALSAFGFLLASLALTTAVARQMRSIRSIPEAHGS